MAIIKNEERASDGIVITGTVSEIQKRGQLYESVIVVNTNDNPPVSVYGEQDPADDFEVGDTVMILGVIIDKPVDRIKGYRGPRDDAVVWHGYSVVVPTSGDE